MDSTNTVEVISSSVSTQNNQHTLPSIQSSCDALFSLQLADYLDNHQPPPSPPSPPSPSQHSITTNSNHDLPPLQSFLINNDDSSSDDDSTTGSTLLWVPADRHPEIAPSEFTKWLETNGSSTLTRKASSLRRKPSVLSHIHIPSDALDTATTTLHTSSDVMCPKASILPDHGEQETISPLPALAPSIEFDRHSPVQDTSRVLVPPRGNHSLLRRKAFSARGRGRKPSQSRHGHNHHHQHQYQQQQQATDSSECTHPTMEPVRLYDRPVSMNEWIDLGSASLDRSSSDDSQQGILSRVHDAESQLLSQLTPPEDHPPPSQLEEAITPIPNQRNDRTEKDGGAREVTASAHHDTTHTVHKQHTPCLSVQRASSERISSKLERKSSTSSWFGGLFGGDKEKRRSSLRRVEDEKYAQKKQQQQQQQQQQEPPSTPIPTRANSKDTTRTTKKSTSSGLGSFFSRNNNGQQQHKRLLKFQQQVLSGVTAPLLLGKPSFSKSIRPPPSPPLEESQKYQQQQQQQQQPIVYHSYRLPIHVERAIYRLSHYKLADPRRPLQHQVVISNLMFWYLSVINTQQQQQQPSSTLISNVNQQHNTSPSTNTNAILSSNTTTHASGTLHAHFDDDAATPPSKKGPLYKGQKSGRIGIPKPRPPYINSNKVAALGYERKTMINSNDTKLDNDDNNDDDNDDEDDDDDDGDDDLPLSFYKQQIPT